MSKVRVYLEPTGRRIEPFGDPVGETPIQNRPLKVWQDEAIRQAGFVRITRPRPPCLVIPDTLLVTAGALQAFVQGAAGANAVLVLKHSRFTAATAHVQPGVVKTQAGFRFESVRFVTSDRSRPIDVLVDPQERIFAHPVPRHRLGEDRLDVGIARHPLMTLHHWLHILWANQYAGGIAILAAPPWKTGLRLAVAAMRARSLNRWKVLGKLNHVGRGCDIHPTAIVEGCRLGDGVQVGPYARVLFSTLGDKACVLGGAQVEFSVLGAQAIVSERVVLRFSVLYPEARASQYLMQQCVLGRQAITTGGAFTQDLNFDKEIRVMLDGKLHATGTRFLGAAFGHRCRIGTGFWLASGRMVPNDYFLIRDPALVLSKLPGDLDASGPLVVDGNRLKPQDPSGQGG